MHPSSRIVQILSADRVERKSLPPHAAFRPLVHALDETGEHPRMRIGRSCREEDGVGMPCHGQDGALERLLQVLRHPPVVLLFKVADGDDTRARADGELLLRRRPAHEGGGPVDAQEDERRFPAGGGGFPDVGVSVWRVLWLTRGMVMHAFLDIEP